MINLKKLLLLNEIDQIYISKSVKESNKMLLNYYHLNEYINSNDNTIFFGLYNIEDYNKLYYHKGKKWLLFEGNEVDINSNYHNKLLEYTLNINLNGIISFYIKNNDKFKKFNIKPLLINPYD